MADFINDFIKYLPLATNNPMYIVGGVVGFFVILMIVWAVISMFSTKVTKFKKVALYFPANKTQCLHIAEIEIYDAEDKKVQVTDNMITMSSVYTGDGVDMSKKKMIDNDTKTIAHTNCGTGENLSITFPTETTISKVKIVNREGANAGRIVGAILSLQVSDTDKIELPITKSQSVYNFTLKDKQLTVV